MLLRLLKLPVAGGSVPPTVYVDTRNASHLPASGFVILLRKCVSSPRLCHNEAPQVPTAAVNMRAVLTFSTSSSPCEGRRTTPPTKLVLAPSESTRSSSSTSPLTNPPRISQIGQTAMLPRN